MDVISQARRYIEAVPPAVSGNGGHNQTYSVAMYLVEGFALSSSDARSLMLEYSARCDPPWSECEIDHKLADAERKANPAKRGKLINRGVQSVSRRMSFFAASNEARKMNMRQKPVHYEISDSLELPEPIKDGTRLFLRTVFEAGEGIRICQARPGDDNREVPKDAGLVLSREEWLRKLDDAKGNPNKFLKTSERNGIFVSVNPMKVGGSKDSDVTAFRHALLEFDSISIQEQWGIITQSQIPCAAVISSGGKSVHAWIKVNAKDRNEFAERVQLIYQHFSQYKPDEKNKNPSRFSRLPNCERGSSRQELLAVNIGCESFIEWLELQQVESLGQSLTPAELDAFDTTNDPGNLLGNRWICRGMSCLIVGPSGVGKSSLNLQLSVCWAIGKSAFGIETEKPLKSLIIQAENDTGDLSEMFKGVCAGLGIEQMTPEWDLVQKHLVFVRDNSHTGWDFCETVRRLIERHKPDLVWLDPILSFVGDDLSRQQVIGQFFRNWLNPILDATGVACFCIHHTGKPPSDKGARQHWQTSDFAYAGIGSSDLTNWARAVIILQDRGHGLFEMKLAKRGKRANVKLADESVATSIWIRQSSTSIFWEQAEAPEPEKQTEKEPKLTKPQQISTLNLGTFLSACPKGGEGLREIVRRLKNWLGTKDCQKRSLAACSEKTIRDSIGLMLDNDKLTLTDDKYAKGPQA